METKSHKPLYKEPKVKNTKVAQFWKNKIWNCREFHGLSKDNFANFSNHKKALNSFVYSLYSLEKDHFVRFLKSSGGVSKIVLCRLPPPTSRQPRADVSPAPRPASPGWIRPPRRCLRSPLSPPTPQSPCPLLKP